MRHVQADVPDLGGQVVDERPDEVHLQTRGWCSLTLTRSTCALPPPPPPTRYYWLHRSHLVEEHVREVRVAVLLDDGLLFALEVRSDHDRVHDAVLVGAPR